MEISWLSLIPPLIVILTALIMRNINIALLISIISASIIAAGYLSPYEITSLFINRLWIQIIDPQKWYLYFFLITTATFIALFEKTGCASYLAHLATHNIRSKKTIETSSLLISSMLFIDDYLSILTTGFIITPLAKHFAIAREKIAFLVHSMAGPIVILAPISSWLATIITYLNESGVQLNTLATTRINTDPFSLYLNTIPFISYAIINIATVWFIVRNTISFGPMRDYEWKERTMHTADKKIITIPETPGSLLDLIIPFITLLGSMIIGILYNGGYHLFGGHASFISAIQNSNNIFLIMCLSSSLTVLIALIRAILQGTITITSIPTLFITGYTIMKGAIFMVFLASVLGYMLKNDLQTGTYLAHTLLNGISLYLMPLVFFIVSLIITISTGSAWATFAIMLPIGIPMITSLANIPLPALENSIPILCPLLGAIFSGAVMGDHLSPLSETTMMTATCTKTNPLTHAYTQFFYAIPTIVGTIFSFSITGLLINYPWWINSIITNGSGILISCSIALLAHHYHRHEETPGHKKR